MSTTATLPVRTTRGKRMKALIGEAEDADDEFWGQDFFAEEGGDDAYEKSDSETSVYDSDFSDQELDQEDEEDEVEADEDPDKRKKKKLLPPGSQRPKKSSSQRKAGTSSTKGHVRHAHAMLLMGETRKSSRSSVVEASLRHEEHKRMQQVEQQIRKFKRESESAGKAKTANVTMYDLLKESCHVTEQVNAASLKHLLEREEEAKRRHSAQSRKHFLGPKVKYHSYKGEDGLARNEFSFLDGAEPPSTSARSINAKPPSNPTCAVTGRPAKYKDPATGLHYSDANAFKAVRANKQKHLEQQPNPAVIVQVGGSSGSSAKPKAGLLKLKIKPPRLVVKPPTN